MRKITGILVKRFWGLCAFLVIGLAVLVTVGRELAPQLSQYKPEVERWLSRQVKAEVSIGALAASWEGLSPELELRQVRVSGPRGDEVFAVDRALVELSLLRSLANRELAVDKLHFDQVSMGLRQNAAGIWSLNGIDASALDDRIDVDDPLDIFLLGDHIELRDVRFRFDFRTGHSSEVSLPHLVLENQGNFHRLTSQLAVDRSEEVLSLVIEARGDPRDREGFSARGHLRLRQFELEKAVAALPGDWWDGLPDQEWRKGHQLDLELWIDVAPGMVMSTRGRLDIGELPVGLDQNLAVPKRSSAAFDGRWAGDGSWHFDIHDLNLAWEEHQAPALDLRLSSAGLGEAMLLQTASLDLGEWHQTLQRAGLFEGHLRQALDALSPRGRLRNLHLSIAGTRPEDLLLKANVEELAVDSWRGAPAVAGASGYLEATPFDGFFEVDSSAGFSMLYPTLYREPFVFETARGRVDWRIDEARESIRVHSGLLAVDSEVGQGRGYFSLFVPFDWGSQPEELVLQVGLRNSDARYHDLFTPYVLPEALTGWLAQSVGGGQVSSGGFVYRGGFSRGAVERAAIQLFLDVEDAELNYHPDWPALSQARGTFWLDDQRMKAAIESARLYESEVADAEVSVELRRGRAALLSVDGRLNGSAADGLRVLRNTPLQTRLSLDWLDDWTLSGGLQTTLDFSLPLQASAVPQINDLSLALSEGDLSTGALDLPFENVQAQLRYDDRRGLRSEALRAELWGETLSGRIRPAGEAEARGFLLALDGQLSAESLRRWAQQPDFALARGETPVRAELELGLDRAGRELDAELRISSTLAGVELDLPSPLGKSAQEERDFSLRYRLAPVAEAGQLQLSYGKMLQGEIELAKRKVLRAGIGVNAAAPAAGEDEILLRGELDRVDLREWQELAGQLLPELETVAAGRGPRSAFDLKIGELRYDKLNFADLQVSGREDARGWQLQARSEALAGQARWFRDPKRPLSLELDHLRLPKLRPEPELPEYWPFVPAPTAADRDPLAAVDPHGLPAMNVAIGELEVDGEDYGRWSFQLRPTASGMVAREIVGDVRGGQIIGLEVGSGAELYWDREEGESRSRFNGRFVSANLGDVLQRWGQPHLLDSESSRFNVRLSWAGSPAAISVTGLEGDMVMAIEEGTFIRGAGEASTGSALLELIAFFNFDTWLRRLSLDFSDLSRAGTSFETIDGALKFDQGKVLMNTPLVVNSTSSRFQMAGVVDLVESELDTKLVATIPVGGNLTFVAALAGMGLPTVAGMWLISKVFEEQIGKMSSLSFRVTGPLNDPETDFVRLFDDEAVQQESSR